MQVVQLRFKASLLILSCSARMAQRCSLHRDHAILGLKSRLPLAHNTFCYPLLTTVSSILSGFEKTSLIIHLKSTLEKTVYRFGQANVLNTITVQTAIKYSCDLRPKSTCLSDESGYSFFFHKWKTVQLTPLLKYFLEDWVIERIKQP